jgi:hypothetical protein
MGIWAAVGCPVPLDQVPPADREALREGKADAAGTLAGLADEVSTAVEGVALAQADDNPADPLRTMEARPSNPQMRALRSPQRRLVRLVCGLTYVPFFL